MNNPVQVWSGRVAYHIKSELETFAQILKPSRQGFLPDLDYSVLFPSNDTAVYESFKRPAGTMAVSKFFSFRMQGLFDTLHRLDGPRHTTR